MFCAGGSVGGGCLGSDVPCCCVFLLFDSAMTNVRLLRAARTYVVGRESSHVSIVHVKLTNAATSGEDIAWRVIKDN